MSHLGSLVQALTSWLVYRSAYLHLFIHNEGRTSMLHMQNPLTFLAPELNVGVEARISVYSDMGVVLTSKRFRISPLGTLAVTIEELLDGCPEASPFGSLTLDIKAPKEYREHIRQIGPRFKVIGSPFYMRYFDGIGSQAYVHSIEVDPSGYRGVSWPLRRPVASEARYSQWQSSRTIELKEGERAVAYVVNHRKSSWSSEVRWVTDEGHYLVSENLVLGSRGVAEFSTPDNFRGTVYLQVDSPSSPNAKPYVLLESRSGMFGLTHG